MTTAAAGFDADSFARRFAPSAPRNRAVRKLHTLLEDMPPPDATLRERAAHFERLGRWVVSGPKAPELSDAPVAGEPPASTRLRLLVHVVEQVPEWREPVARLFRSVLTETRGLHLFSRTGIPSDRGFYAESVDRLSKRFLPTPRDDHDLGQLLERFLISGRAAEWLEALEPALPGRLFASLCAVPGCHDMLDGVVAAMVDAVLLLATRVSALGLSERIKARSPACELRDSPFFRLPRACDAFVERGSTERTSSVDDLGELIEECRRVLHAATRALETRGVSVDVVYRIELIGESLTRLELLLGLLSAALREEREVVGAGFVAALVRERLRERSVMDLSRTNLHLLTRKIIERAGTTGEHYITSSRGEWVKMFFSAAGGGILTTFTAALKAAVSKLPLAPFQLGLAHSINYSASFLLLQLLGFTLATKQPSMTAATLAGALRQVAGPDPPKRDAQGTTSPGTVIPPAAGTAPAVAGTPSNAVEPVPPSNASASAASAASAGAGREPSRAFRLRDASKPGIARTQQDRLEALVTIIARMVRSQLAAALGNIGLVVPGAIVFHNVWWRLRGASFFDLEKARHVLEEHHPLHSGTLVYAALTGCVLWLGSVCAGWLENWAVYRRIPEAIEDHRVAALFGRRVMRWVARVFLRNVSGFGGNVSLGVMLGMLPVFGKFLGLPLDIRHVTLASGSLTFAACALPLSELATSGFFWAVVGIVGVLACNFGVSFALALTVALRARGVELGDRFRLLAALVRRIVRSPLEFLIPPKGSPPTETHAAH